MRAHNHIRRLATGLAWRVRCLWAATFARRTSLALLDARKPQRLLIVCLGNICRSPYVAEVLSRKLTGLCEVRSAGFYPLAGRQAPAVLVGVALAMGIDLRMHRSAVVSAVDAAWADAIVLMDRHNWQALRNLGADPDKLIWLGTFDAGGEIPDPYGLPAATMRDVVHRMQRCAEALAREIALRRSSPATQPAQDLE